MHKLHSCFDFEKFGTYVDELQKKSMWPCEYMLSGSCTNRIMNKKEALDLNHESKNSGKILRSYNRQILLEPNLSITLLLILPKGISNYTLQNIMSLTPIFPPKPNAIATLLRAPPVSTTTLSLDRQIQTLVFSIQKSIQPFQNAKYRKENPFYYPPEIVIIVEKEDADSDIFVKSIQKILSVFTVRIIEAESIHLQGKDFSELLLFQKECYNRILYLPPNSLVTKDVSSFLRLGQSSTNGIIAASYHEDPTKFDFIFALINPSNSLFSAMKTNLEERFIKEKSFSSSSTVTDFLNYFYRNNKSILSLNDPVKFLLESPNTYPDAAEDSMKTIPVYLFLEQPFPWEKSKSGDRESDQRSTKENRVWKSFDTNCKIYVERRQLRQKEETSKRQKKKKLSNVTPSTSSSSNATAKTEASKKAHINISARYKKLRKEGLSAKEAMMQARLENGETEQNQEDPGSSVAAMFGLS